MTGDGSGTPAGDGISVERDLTARDGGVLATYTLTAAGGEPVTVDVVDALPSRPDQVREIGVHPEFEPATSDVDGERIVFRETVDPGGELVVKYGISTVDPVDGATLAEWERDTHPRVMVREDGAEGPLLRSGANEASPTPAEAVADAADAPPETGDGSPTDPGADGNSPGGDGTDDPPIDGDLDLASGDDAIIDDLADMDEEPRDFVAQVSTDGFAADAMADVDTDEAAMDVGAGSDGSDDPSSDDAEAWVAAMADESAAGSAESIRVDRFRSRLAGLAGAAIALHAAADDDAAEAVLDGMAAEVEAVEDQFEALRRAFSGDG